MTFYFALFAATSPDVQKIIIPFLLDKFETDVLFIGKLIWTNNNNNLA